MPKVSIIVPVYKVEQYIRECLDSIKQQTFLDWECLLIDDGSPDNSGKICDEYAQGDARFKVFHVENGGVSRARNIGLDNMMGEWVMFVDSDDAIAKNTLELCMNNVLQCDIDVIQFSFAHRSEELGEPDISQTQILSLQDYLKERKYQVCAGGSFLNTSVIKEFNLRFDTQLKLAEDQMFMYHYMDQSQRFMKLGMKLYWYRDTANSATSHQKPEDIEKSITQLTTYKKEHPHWGDVIDKVMAGFLIDVILNKDVTYSEMIALTKKAHLTNSNMLTGTYKVFYNFSKVNILIGIMLVKLKYKLFK